MERAKSLPFLLSPACKDYLWGGRRLKDDYGKQTDLKPLAETWECSTHPDGLSSAANGEYAGLTLKDILRARPEFLGTHAAALSRDGDLPIMIKFIDARKDLSVQVHPGDKYAGAAENGQRGKTELWYVLDAKRDSRIVYGFKCDMTKERLRSALESGTVERYLQYIPIKTDDVFYLAPGTVHAIGGGSLVAEVQESSNLTYRLYDYNRLDRSGKPRELHIDKAMDVLDFRHTAEPRQPMRTLNFRRGYATELLGRCRYFQVERFLLNTERVKEMAQVRTGSTTFQVLLVTDGCGMIATESLSFPFFKGDCIFVPAESEQMTLHGNAVMLKVGC
ncbi:MAG TPA: class I mannose-6-phosphate isomerase [Lachnospiraceae bacterium]|nr:class I mannose-6-phosphate isomerase [Lachnospiraceae bacterium]